MVGDVSVCVVSVSGSGEGIVHIFGAGCSLRSGGQFGIMLIGMVVSGLVRALEMRFGPKLAMIAVRPQCGRYGWLPRVREL